MANNPKAPKAKVGHGAPQPMRADFDGPGPFELPRFGAQVMLSPYNADVFLLRLETADKGQLVWLPIDTKALPALKLMIDHALNDRGLGQKKH